MTTLNDLISSKYCPVCHFLKFATIQKDDGATKTGDLEILWSGGHTETVISCWCPECGIEYHTEPGDKPLTQLDCDTNAVIAHIIREWQGRHSGETLRIPTLRRCRVRTKTHRPFSCCQENG